jgi:transposase
VEQLANWIGEADGVMERATRENEVCRRLIAIPGIGRLTATALIAAIENGAAFRKDREFSAWVVWFQGKLRPVARRSSEAATPTYESWLFRGARAVMLRRTKQSSGLSTWLEEFTLHKHHNVAAVALANKMVRIAWAVLARESLSALSPGRRSLNLRGLQMTTG